MTGTIPEWLLTIAALATVFVVMFDLGLALERGELRWVIKRPGLLAKGLFSVLIAVPVVALGVSRAVDLPRPVEVGIVLMAISPGAPMALRRSLDAGGHRSFAPALQITVVALAAFSMPLSIAALEALYGARAVVQPHDVFRQVFVAQLMPLGLAVLFRRARPRAAAWLAQRAGRAARVLFVVLVLLVLADAWQVVIEAGPRALIAIAVITLVALAIGHALGGPEPSTRTATAISSAMRNPSLALLVATLNAASPAITATVLAYLIVATLIVLPYVIWRRRTHARAKAGDPPPTAR